jgi:hypothetical protein
MRIYNGLWVCVMFFLMASLVTWVAPVPLVRGQDKSKSKKPAKAGKTKLANTKSLDLKADQIQASFTKDAEELAGQYYDAGHLDKAKALLESVLAVNPEAPMAVNPEAPNIQRKLDQVKEGILNSNDVELEVSASQGWKATGALVTAKKSLRIKAEGTYRFEVAASGINAAGFPVKDPAEDMVPGVPCGALAGVIFSDGKPGKPFLVGDLLDLTPAESGMLFLKINAPPANKNSGKIKVAISGNVQLERQPARDRE